MKQRKTVSKNSGDTNGDYPSLLAEVKERIRAAQYEALKAVNTELVGLYWDIGRLIVTRQADAEHGASIAVQLALDLRIEFPGIKGFLDEMSFTCGNSTCATTRTQKCNHWLHKSPGLTIWQYFSAARMLRSANFTFA